MYKPKIEQKPEARLLGIVIYCPNAAGNYWGQYSLEEGSFHIDGDITDCEFGNHVNLEIYVYKCPGCQEEHRISWSSMQ